jgi:hypothetical protein
MRKRRERQRGKHAQATSEAVEPDDVESDDAGPDEDEAVVIAAGEAESAVAQVPEDTTPEPESADPPKPAEPETADPVTAGPRVSAEPGDDLEALGRILERSLGGSTEGPLPTVSSPTQTIDLSTSVLPPDISATPEDILGVPTQHSAMQELQQQVTDNEGDEESPKPVTLSGAGTGAAPMEAFEERAQMAKEVLRATSSQPSHANVPVSGVAASGGENSAQEEPERTEERDEDVRFSEDLTISVKRRRKLFGR